MNPAEQYILDSAEPYRSILLQLQATIEGLLPEVELRFSYKIPFYYLEGKPFCFLNQTGDYVDVGFWHSAYLKENRFAMVSEGRKVMLSLRYRSLAAIDLKLLQAVLMEAEQYKGLPYQPR